MLKPIGATDFVSQGAAIELSKKRRRVQQRGPVSHTMVGMPDQRLAGRVLYLRKRQSPRTGQKCQPGAVNFGLGLLGCKVVVVIAELPEAFFVPAILEIAG